MGSSALILAVVAVTTGASISKTDANKQDAFFNQCWNDDFVWNFAELPTKGTVPKARIPYSGNIYLDKQGGTAAVLRKYDRAINRGRRSAASWEFSDTSAARRRRGIFSSREDTDWYGHCNGWAAASIRHAEPQKSVHAYGTVFTPSDIKAMLAEVYMYNDVELLAGYESHLNAGTFHAILANWIGRGSHPIAMESDPSKEKWNYPVYAFASSYAKRSPRQIEVNTNIVYSKDAEDREHDKSPNLRRIKKFHYMLNLDSRGNIIGGYYFGDSTQIDFLWVPRSPKLAGAKGNESGNPYVDVKTVLAIWRQSVASADRRKWLNVDPTEEDRAVEVFDPTAIIPRNIRIVPSTLPTARVEDSESDRR